MMTRIKRIQQDSKEKEGSFPKAINGILTEKDQAPRKVEVPTNGNPMANKESEKEILTPLHVSVPFPQRLKDKSEDGQLAIFVEMLKKVHISVPFAEAISQMPKYAKYLKELHIKESWGTLFHLVSMNNALLYF